MSGQSGSPAVYALRNYAVLADGERGALIDPAGNVAWMCAPRWHDPALFSTLIGGRSVYTVTPDARFVWGGRYEPGSLIWRSRWITEDAIVECREALALPATEDRVVLLRHIEGHSGGCRLRIRLDPRADYDQARLAEPRRDDRGIWHGRAGDLELHWLGGAEAHERDGALELQLEIEEGDSHDLVFVVGDLPEHLDPGRLWQQTADEWAARCPPLHHALAPRDTQQALAVLTGLSSAGGGMVAAVTLGLPERSGEGTSYDYRYAWIRDGCYAGQAAAAAGALPLMSSTLGFVRERLLEHGPDLSPAYTAQGEPVPEESRVELPGYPGGTDILGNRVTDQFQLDAFGEIMLLIAAAAEHERVEAVDWQAAELAAQSALDRLDDPDAGIWELDPDEWTHSRLCVAAGLKALAAQDPPNGAGDRWRDAAERIVERCSSRALHPSGRWQRSPKDERVDAALLMAAVRGALPPDDPRSEATLGAVLDELEDEHFVYRFRHDERPLGEAEGAFLLCGFWAALACKQRGAEADALRFFERNRAAYGSPGLLAEEYDVDQRQLRGNLPQAFVHALLLESAARLAA
jgi:GH15 family glucan-1,4-alpha-glucosidase